MPGRPDGAATVLDQHRKLFDLAQRELGPVRLRQRHREAVDHVEDCWRGTGRRA